MKLHHGWVYPCICKNLYCKDYACWVGKETTWPNPDLSCTCGAPKGVELHPGSAHGLMRSCMIVNNVDGTLESQQTTVLVFVVLSALQHLFCYIIFKISFKNISFKTTNIFSLGS